MSAIIEERTVLTGEVVEGNFEEHAARRGTEKIKLKLERIGKDAHEVLALIDQAVAEKWHAALGYNTHAEYIDAEFGDALRGLPSTVRPEFSQRLTAHGLSTRTTAKALGVDHATVINDTRATGENSPVELPPTITGSNGKTYQRKVQKQQVQEGAEPVRPPAPPKYGGNRRKHLQVIESMITSIQGLGIVAEELTEFDSTITAEEAARLADDLTESLRPISRIKQLLKQESAK